MNSLFDRIASEIAAAGHPDESDAASSTDSDARAAAWPRPTGDPSGAVVLGGSSVWPAPDVSTQIERPLAAERQCSRSGCSNPAAVTLSYHYGQSQVWIDRLSPEREPHMYDLCEQHAERLSVPQGWHLDDRRGGRPTTLIAV